MRQSKSTAVRAILELIENREGCRRTPVECKLGRYLPDHQFPWMKSSDAFMGRINFAGDREFLYPGEITEVVVSFFSKPELDEKLKPGMSWDIKEGHRIVGKGKLIEVLDT
ncbi:MAG: hypothetical protein ABJ308_08025 [Halieaceae bacterium]